MNPLKLTFTANEQALTKTDNFTDFASNTVSYIEATFTLGENWTGYDSVRAVWKTDYYTISTVLDANFTCVVPTEVLRYKAKVFVNLVGSIVENDALTDRLTTFPVLALTVKANAAVNGTETAPVTPSQFEQFVEAVQDAAGSISDYSYDSEAWAVGKRGGVDVPSTDETYHNNSKYWAEQNAGLSDEVADLKEDLEQAIEDFAVPTQEAVDNWLDAHPEATTTVQDHSLSIDKMIVGTLGYITPEMFGAKGDGTTDDSTAFVNMLADSNDSIVLGADKTYWVKQDLLGLSNKIINLNGSTIKLEKTIELIDNNKLFNGTIQNHNNTSFSFRVSINGVSNVIQGIDFTSNVSSSHCVATHENSLNTSIKNCSFDGNAKIGINVGGKDCVIDRCHFKSTIDPTLYSDGVKCSSDNSVDNETPCARNTKIVNCLFERLNDNGIDCFSGADGLIVDNCIFNNDNVPAIEIKNIFMSPEDSDYNTGFSVPGLRICRDIHIRNCVFNGTQYIFVASVLIGEHYSGETPYVANITCKDCLAPNIDQMVFATNEYVENVVVDNLVCNGITGTKYQYLYGKRMVLNNIDNPHLGVNIFGEAMVTNSKLNKINVVDANANAQLINCKTYLTSGAMIDYTAGARLVVDSCDALSCGYILALLKECEMIIIKNCLCKMVMNNGYGESAGNVYILNNLFVQKLTPSDNQTAIAYANGNSIIY